MQQLIGDFIRALRQAGLPVSSSETLDAINAIQLVGINNRPILKQSLGLVLAKTQEHKLEYSNVFDRFFADIRQSTDDHESLSGDSDGLVSDDQPSEGDNLDSSSADALGENASSDIELQSQLGQQLLSGDASDLAVAIAAAGNSVGVSQMQVFTQQALFSFRIQQQLGMDALNSELNELAQDENNSALVQLLTVRRNGLRNQVRDYVEQQYALFAKAEGTKLRERNLQQMSFTSIDHHYYEQMSALVRRAAKQLARLHSRRRKVTKRGLLDVRKTIAANAAFDGALFHTKWKERKIERPKVFVICDVSGSVSQVARFLLLFVHSLQDVLPRVRSFVFSGEMGEVTEYFEKEDMDVAFARVMEGWANRSTDYGRALDDFEKLALNEIDNKSTVIMLGDARNNNGDGNINIWKQVYQRSNRVLWLNPERESSWNTGDSIMQEYAPYCSRVETCNSLRDLTRILNSLLKYT